MASLPSGWKNHGRQTALCDVIHRARAALEDTRLADTPEGPLELRQRGERGFLITIAGRVLMTSEATRSEHALARLACEALGGRPRPRLLLGGLGMGFTLREALDQLPPDARVVVVDLNPVVVDWCRGPLAALTVTPWPTGG